MYINKLFFYSICNLQFTIGGIVKLQIKYINKLLHLCIYAILFLIPLSFWLPAHEAFEMPKSTNFYVLISLAAGLFLTKMILERNYYFKWSSFSLPVAGLTLVFFLSMLKGTGINPHAFPMHFQFFKLLFAAVLLYFIIINTFTVKDIPKLLYFILAAHFIVVVYGILQLLGIDFIKWVSFGENRVYSTLGNPDYMAAQFSILIPLMIVLMLSPVKKLVKFSLSLFLVLMFILIIVAHGRGAWLGFLGSLAYMFIMFGILYGKSFFLKYRFFFAGILGFIIFLGIFFSGPIKNRISQGLDVTSDSVAVRLFYWESALQMAKYNPVLGAGVGGFSLNTAFYQRKALDRWEKVYPPIAAKVQPHVELYTHNDYLQTLAETGFLGFGAFVWLFFSVFIMSLFKALKEENPLIKNILLGITGAVIAFLINALLNFPWRVMPTLLLLWSIFAIFSLTEPKKAKRFSASVPNGTAAIILTVAFIISAMQVNTFAANIMIRAGQSAFSAGKYELARDTFERSLASNARGTDRIELVLYAGNSYNSMKNIDKAIEYYNKGLKMFPHFIESHYNVGNVYMNNKMYDDAIREYDKVLSLNPKFSAAINNKANIYFNQGELEKAKEMYLQALKIKENSVEARYNLAATYFRLKDYKNAYAEFNNVLKYDPDYKLAIDWINNMKKMGLNK